MPNKLCADCGRSFRTRAGLFKHVNAVHKQTYKYKCQTCDKAFAEKHQLKAHLVQHRGDPVECHICQKTFTTAYSLKRHMAGAHENVRHTCTTCKSVFADKDGLKEYVSGLHNLHTSINKRKAILSNGNEPSFTILLRLIHVFK